MSAQLWMMWLYCSCLLVAMSDKAHAFLQLTPPTQRYHSSISISLDPSRVWLSRPRSTSAYGTAQNDDFWAQQKELAAEMDQKTKKSLKQEQMEIFKQERLALVYDTMYFSALFFATFWLLSSDPLTALSYVPGAVLGLFYSYGLGKSVEKIGASPMDLDDNQQGSGVGEARFAFLILLFLLVGKFQSEGLQPLPAIGGFFTYQLAALKRGLQEME